MQSNLRYATLNAATLAITACLFLVSPLNAAEKPGQRPNLVFVFADQMRGSAMGFLGEEPVLTPNLDRLAEQSIVFTEAASNYPVCSPFRAMLMTGRYPHHNGVVSNCLNRTAPYGVQLKQDSRCWSDVLSDKGYSLGYIGKWHLEAPYEPYIDCANNRGPMKWNEWTPPNRRHGFTYWYGYNTYDFHMRPLYWDTDAGRTGFHYVDQWGPEHEADLAIEFLKDTQGKRRDPNKPFALVVSMNPPHTPYNLHPEKYIEPYAKMSDEALFARPNIPPANTPNGKLYRQQIRHYYAMITGVDEQVGRILDALNELEMADNTLFVFTSDHGNCLGIHKHKTKNVPEEESMQIPLLVRFPGKLKPGRDDLLISVPDMYPTMLGLMGMEEEIPKTVDGTNFAPLLLTGKGERPTSQVYINVPVEDRSKGRRGVRTDRYTLVIDHLPNKEESVLLFDRKNDPYQLDNLAEQQPELVEKLKREELEPWLKRMDDPWK